MHLPLPPDPDELAALLAERLEQPLPGPVAMRPWAPQLAYGRQYGPAPRAARQAAVAMLLYPRAGEWYLPLTLRPATLANHASQVSLPGGSLDAGETHYQAAARELEEELGIPRDVPQLLGTLTPTYVFISNFYVVPCVAIVRERPPLRPSPGEVEAVLELPLHALPSEAVRETMWIERRGLRFRAPCWQVGGQRVWGASAQILAEFAAVLEDCVAAIR